MPVEFIGFVGNFRASETVAPVNAPLDRPWIEALAKAQEVGGFDRVLLAFNSTSPENLLVAQHVLSVTDKLKVMIAHRPGFVAPTLFARQIATLDHLFGGDRVSVHVITGGVDAELAQDGDHLSKDARYARAADYLRIVRKSWTATEPYSHKSDWYQVDRGISDIRPRKGAVKLFVGGASRPAIDLTAEHADVYALWGETLEQTRQIISEVTHAAEGFGRRPEFSLSLRPILAETEEAAWAQAAQILETARALRQGKAVAGPGASGQHNARSELSRQEIAPPNEGARRLLDAAAKGARLDKRLWTELAALTGATGNSTSLVGTPDQVAEAMLDYYDLGVTHFLIRGFEPLEDAALYGRELIPRVRALVAARDAARSAALAAE